MMYSYTQYKYTTLHLTCAKQDSVPFRIQTRAGVALEDEYWKRAESDEDLKQ